MKRNFNFGRMLAMPLIFVFMAVFGFVAINLTDAGRVSAADTHDITVSENVKYLGTKNGEEIYIFYVDSEFPAALFVFDVPVGGSVSFSVSSSGSQSIFNNKVSVNSNATITASSYVSNSLVKKTVVKAVKVSSIALPTVDAVGGDGTDYVLNNDVYYYRSNISFLPSCSDAYLDYFEYQLDSTEGDWKQCAAGESFKIWGSKGEHTLYVRAVNLLGMKSETVEIAIFKDKKAPVLTVSRDSAHLNPNFISGEYYYNSAVTLTAQATDAGVGLKGIEYKLGTGEWAAYDGEIILAENGRHEITFKAVDLLGNCSKESLIINISDIVPNEPWTIFLDSSVIPGEWTKNKAKFTVLMPEGEAMLYLVPGKMDDWAQWPAASGIAYTLDFDGIFDVKFKSVNVYQMESVEKVFENIKIDVTGPSINTCVTDANVWKDGPKTVTIQFSDDESGIVGGFGGQYYIGLDGGAAPAASEFLNSTDGKVIVQLNAGDYCVYVKDAAGNISIYQFSVSKINFILEFNLNGAAWNDYSPENYYNPLSNVALPSAEKLTKTGYTFAGWYDNENFEGTAVTEIASGSEGNKTFFAKWQINSYTVTWKNWDGTVLKTATAVYGQLPPVFNSAIPTRANDESYSYTFNGWTPDAFVVDNNMVFTAVFVSALLPEVPEPPLPEEKDNNLLPILLLVGAGILLVGAVSVFTFTVRKKK